MRFSALKSGSDVRGRAVGDDAQITDRVAASLGMAFALRLPLPPDALLHAHQRRQRRRHVQHALKRRLLAAFLLLRVFPHRHDVLRLLGLRPPPNRRPPPARILMRETTDARYAGWGCTPR